MARVVGLSVLGWPWLGVEGVLNLGFRVQGLGFKVLRV